MFPFQCQKRSSENIRVLWPTVQDLETLPLQYLMQNHNSFINPIIQNSVLVYGCTHESVLEIIFEFGKRITRIT